MLGLTRKQRMPTAAEALPGRISPLAITDRHFVLNTKLQPPYPQGMALALVGLGCFWGAERKFWKIPGVYSTAVGYAGGATPNPTYEEVCSGMTGHNEVVRIVFDPAKVPYRELLRVFWESHNPTQGMQQGNDVGTQYRSGIYCYDQTQLAEAVSSQESYQQRIAAAGFAKITTEVVVAPEFYFAEDYHQQYLAKNPAGYCGLGGTGVTCE
jgi:peptide-methionine (S)-S-oxide reductase